MPGEKECVGDFEFGGAVWEADYRAAGGKVFRAVVKILALKNIFPEICLRPFFPDEASHRIKEPVLAKAM